MNIRTLLCRWLVPCLLLSVLCSCGQSAPTWQEQYDLGVRYLSEGNYEEAIIAFTAAIEIDPKRAEAYVGRGDAYVAQEEYALAEEDYLAAIQLDELLVDAYNRLADLYVEQGDLTRVLELLRQGYEATGDQGLLSRLEALEELSELPDLPDDLPDAAIVVSMYSAEYGFAGHDAYQFDQQGRMTSNTWYDSSNEMLYQELWEYDEESQTTTSTIGEYDYETDQWSERTETYSGTENMGWYWYSMGSENGEYITDPTLETEDGRLELEEGGYAQYGYDEQGRAITIHTYRADGALAGHCVVTYTR